VHLRNLLLLLLPLQWCIQPSEQCAGMSEGSWSYKPHLPEQHTSCNLGSETTMASSS